MTTTPHPSPRYVNSYAKANLPLFPLKRYDATVRDLKNGGLKKAGKTPLITGFRMANPLSVEHATNWLNGDCNVGVLIPEDWIVVDFDPRNAGPEPQKVWDAFLLRFGIALKRYAIVRTGGGGYHVYMRNPKKLRVHKGLEDFLGIDFQSYGRYVVAAGSIHPETLQEYRLVEGSIEFFASASAPDILFDALKFEAPKVGDNDTSFGQFDIDGIEDLLPHLDPTNFGRGSQERWFSLMCSVHYLSGGAAEDEFVNWCHGDPTYDDASSEQSVRNRWRSLSTSADHKMLSRSALFRELEAAGKGDLIPRPKVGAQWSDIEDNFDLASFGLKPIKDDDGVDIPGTETTVDHTIDTQDQDVPPLEDDGTRIIKKFDAEYALVVHGGSSRIVRWVPEKSAIKAVEPDWASISGTLSPEFVEPSQLKKSLHRKKIKIAMPGEDAPKLNYEFDYWFEATDHRYHSTSYAPGSPLSFHIGLNHVLNLWRGWTYDVPKLARHSRDGTLPSTKVIHEFLREVISNGDEKSYQYLLNWLAYTYQNPSRPVGVMLVLQGGQGEGKGTLSELWRAPWGVNGFHASTPDDVFSRFSGHLLNKSAVFLDEAFWAGDQSKLGRLKAMITEPSMSIEAKGLQIVETENTMKFMAASNEDWVVPADSDQRRFQVFEVSGAWKGLISEKWTPLRNEMNAGGKAAFFWEMLMRPIPESWHPQRDRVQTDAMRRQARITQGPIAEWLHMVYASGIPYSLEKGGLLYVPAKITTDDFTTFARDSFTARWKFSGATNFEHEIKKIFGGDAITRTRVRAPKTFLDEINSHGKDMMSPWDDGRCYCMAWPSLEKGRAIIASKFSFHESSEELDLSEPVIRSEWDDLEL